jgi:hypothetical protein
MARAIVRYSINGEGSNDTGNRAREGLEASGFEKIGTATFEADGAETRELIAALRALLAVLERPPGGGSLDHLWVYVDNAEFPGRM